MCKKDPGGGQRGGAGATRPRVQLHHRGVPGGRFNRSLNLSTFFDNLFELVQGQSGSQGLPIVPCSSSTRADLSLTPLELSLEGS